MCYDHSEVDKMDLGGKFVLKKSTTVPNFAYLLRDDNFFN
jgi:hypothetical protein